MLMERADDEGALDLVNDLKFSKRVKILRAL
jgi:hypothetical protein